MSLNGSIELLKAFPLDRGSVLSPFVGLEGSFVDRDGFTETGAGVLNLDVDSENDEYLTGLVGLQWVGRYDVGTDLRLKPAARVGVGFQFLDESASTTSTFTASPGTSFTSTGAERGTTSVRVGAGLELGPRWNNRWAVFARYTGDFSSGGNDNIGQLGHSLRLLGGGGGSAPATGSAKPEPVAAFSTAAGFARRGRGVNREIIL